MRHQRQVLDGGKIWHGVLFDDPVELLDMVCEAGSEGRFARYMGSNFLLFGHSHKGGSWRDPVRWFGRTDFRNWGDLRNSVKTVWKPGEDRVKRLLDSLSSHPFIPPKDLRRRNMWRDDGEGDFDLDRFCDGKPAYRGPKRREVIGRQFLTFVVDVAANSDTSADAMYWRAAVAIAAARTLEEFGYGVEIVAYSNLINVLHPPGRSLRDCHDEDTGEKYFGSEEHSRYQDVTAAVWIKRPDDPIDLGMLTAVCAPWFFRLGFFGLYGLIPGAYARYCLGRAVAVNSQWVDDLIGSSEAGGNDDRERVVLAAVWNEESAAELLRASLRKFADPDWLIDHPEYLPGKGGMRL